MSSAFCNWSMENKDRKIFVKQNIYQLWFVLIVFVLFTFVIFFYHYLCINYAHHCNYCVIHEYIRIIVPNISIFQAEFVYLKSEIHNFLSKSLSVKISFMLLCTTNLLHCSWEDYFVEEIRTSSQVKFQLRRFSKRVTA